MVSINMEMPAACSKCSLYESGGHNQNGPYDGACYLAKRCMMGHKVTQGRPLWCPLKPAEGVPDTMDRCYLGSPCRFQTPVFNNSQI